MLNIEGHGMSVKREISVEVAAKTDVPSVASIRTWADAAAEHDDGDICIRVVEPIESKALNKKFRQIDAPTNVLSFPAGERGVLGDVAICAEVARRESREQEKALDAHFAHLVVHGVLHLRGFDHEEDTDAERMERLEIDLLNSLGVANPYE